MCHFLSVSLQVKSDTATGVNEQIRLQYTKKRGEDQRQTDEFLTPIIVNKSGLSRLSPALSPADVFSLYA